MANCNPILVEQYRGGIRESFYRGSFCLVDGKRNIRWSAGDPETLTFPRSALKPFQHIPLVESGAMEYYGINEAELAIMCATHNGEEEQIEVVNEILEKIGLDEGYLQCGAAYPSLREDRQVFYQQGWSPQPIYHGCSGKHAGFLALCQYWGTSLGDYLDPLHPVQKAIRQAVATVHETEPDSLNVAIDGCSAPTFALSVFQQAVGYQNLSPNAKHEHRDACQQITKAMRENPYMVAGKKRYCTELMQAAGDEIVVKTGAEGVFGFYATEKDLGCAIKVDSGQMGHQYAVAQKLLNAGWPINAELVTGLNGYMNKPLHNKMGWEVGNIRVKPEAFE